MHTYTDVILYVLFYTIVFATAWYFSMDIQNASRVLWNACGNLKGKVKHAKPFKRRASDSDFQLIDDVEDNSVPSTPDGRDSWSLATSYRPSRGSANDLSEGIDCGHFTEDEFLARFGGMRTQPFRHETASGYTTTSASARWLKLEVILFRLGTLALARMLYTLLQSSS